MKKGKYAKRTPFVKTLAVAMVLVTLIGCAIGGTLAWLTDETQQVVNTFTVSDIDIKLEEKTKDYKMIPGHTIPKDPKVTVIDGSEDCWLFVKISESKHLDEYIAYAIADGWTVLQLKNLPGETVIYRKVLKTDTVKEFGILGAGSYTDEMGTADVESDDVTVQWTADNVGVKPSVTEQMMEAISGDKVKPTLTFAAYASQLYKTNGVEFTADEAWAIVSGN